MNDEMRIYVVTDEDGNVIKCFYSLIDASDFCKHFEKNCEIQQSKVKLIGKKSKA